VTTEHKHDNPILVTGAAGAVGGIGRNLTEFLLARGHKVRALVRREDERAEALRRLGAEVVEGDLTDLASMHRAIEGCRRASISECLSRRPIWKPRSTRPRWRATTASWLS
jgi:nucleoside-diphosphate-sugar epimerase